MEEEEAVLRAKLESKLKKREVQEILQDNDILHANKKLKTENDAKYEVDACEEEEVDQDHWNQSEKVVTNGVNMDTDAFGNKCIFRGNLSKGDIFLCELEGYQLGGIPLSSIWYSICAKILLSSKF